MSGCFSVARFSGTRPFGRRYELDLDGLRAMLSRCWHPENKLYGQGWSPTKYLESYTYTRPQAPAGSAEPEIVVVHAPAVHRRDEAVVALSALVFDLDHARPDWLKLLDLGWLCFGYTTWSHTHADPRWRLVFPLAEEVVAADWRVFWHSAITYFDLQGVDRSCGDASRFYYCHAASPDADPLLPETRELGTNLLDPGSLPRVAVPLQHEQVLLPSPTRDAFAVERYRGRRMLQTVVERLASMDAGGRQVAVYGAARALGHWVAAGALERDDVHDQLWTASEHNGLAVTSAERAAETERAIRRGLDRGITDGAIDFDADTSASPLVQLTNAAHERGRQRAAHDADYLAMKQHLANHS